MRIGRRVRELRIQTLFSLRDVAERTGLTANYICRLEEGCEVPSYETLETLAEAFDVDLYQLFYADGEPLQTPWLTPRLTLEELLAQSLPPEPLKSKVAVLLSLPRRLWPGRGKDPEGLAENQEITGRSS
ncbi:MAG TPA: helix-turn-helix transcriptional regulator [Terriglobia bacterium]|nr:helix-turn-helix transcriptional regulator [Terriglobia bacterium]